MARAQRDERWPQKPYIVGSGGHPPGTYSDDTQMSLAVARALVEAGVEAADMLVSVADALLEAMSH